MRRSIIPVAAPPRVRQRLTHHEGPVRVLHAGSEAWYLDVGGWAVGLLSREAAHVPCGLRSNLSGSDLVRGDGAGKSGYLEHGTLWLGGQAFQPVRSVDVRAPRITVRHGFRTANSATVKATPPALVAEFVRGIVGTGPDDPGPDDLGPDDPGLDDLGPGDLDDMRMAALAPLLVGAGPGLTPLGDDVLCGWLATHRAASRPTPLSDAVVRRLLGSTTLLSATLLECAILGEVLPEFGAWLRSWGSPDEDACLERLHAVGATSGAGLAAGADLALLSLSNQLKVSA